jgi:hypothetical protein
MADCATLSLPCYRLGHGAPRTPGLTYGYRRRSTRLERTLCLFLPVSAEGASTVVDAVDSQIVGFKEASLGTDSRVLCLSPSTKTRRKVCNSQPWLSSAKLRHNRGTRTIRPATLTEPEIHFSSRRPDLAIKPKFAPPFIGVAKLLPQKRKYALFLRLFSG